MCKYDRDVSKPVCIPCAEKSEAKHARGTGAEAQKIADRLGGFNPDDSQVLYQLYEYFSSSVTHNELKSVAMIAGMVTGVPLDRLALRDKRVLVKWFSENWAQLAPVLPFIHLRDEQSEVINLERQRRDAHLA